MKFKLAFYFLFQILTPPVCEINGCHRKKIRSAPLCRNCYRDLKSLKVDLYQKPKNGERFKLPYLYWDYFIPFFYFAQPLQELMHHFKYNYFFSYSNLMTRLGLKQCPELKIFKNFDMIISVPLHKAKRRFRGYNQSDIIANKIVEELQIPYQKNLISRIKYRNSQTHYSFDKRQTNVEQAFKVNQNLKHKKIILIDDVVTTGATTSSCCKVLKQAGCSKILVISLARAIQV